MKLKPRHMLFAAAATIATVAVSAQTSSELDALKAQMDALQKGQEAMQKDLGEIRKLLSQQRQPAAQPKNAVPPNTVVSLEGRPSKGDAGARLAVIEFLDYQ